MLRDLSSIAKAKRPAGPRPSAALMRKQNATKAGNAWADPPFPSSLNLLHRLCQIGEIPHSAVTARHAVHRSIASKRNKHCQRVMCCDAPRHLGEPLTREDFRVGVGDGCTFAA